MAADAKPIIHRGVALMVCENEAILEETLVSIDLSALDIQRVGQRAIVAPAYQLQQIRQALEDKGMFPRLTGVPVRADYLAHKAASEAAEATGDGESGEADAQTKERA